MAPRLIRVSTRPPCDLLVGPGVSLLLAPWLAAVRPGVRCALVTDSNVAGLHAAPLVESLERAGLRAETIAFAAGEPNKTRRTKESIEDAMLSAGLGRDTVVLALGGGVASDLAGFAAATYQRGVPWIALPTTLLAMVDAAIGGKTGVDHPLGKNLIGAFHQPLAVFADTGHLGTLPACELRSGMAEVVKGAFVRDAAFFDAIESDAAAAGRAGPPPAEWIERACAIKAEIVGADEREGDLRRILNFGHTIGHAMEACSGWSLLHGEAVAIGMVAESRMAVVLGLMEGAQALRLESALAAIGLPTALPALAGADPGSILAATRSDKKARAGRRLYSLPQAPGRMARGPHGYGIEVDESLALRVLEGMRPAPAAR